MNTIEVWKPIKGYEGYYEVSNLGRVKSLICKGYKEKILSAQDNGHGYKQINLRKNGRRIMRYVHRLVAETFLECPNSNMQVNHLDYDRSNNALSNLEWCTRKENVDYSNQNIKHVHFCKTNTGEHHISYRKSKDRYRVTVRKNKQAIEKHFMTLEDAIKFRDEFFEKNTIART